MSFADSRSSSQNISVYGTITSEEPTTTPDPTSTPTPSASPSPEPTTTPTPTPEPTTQRIMLGAWGGETAIQPLEATNWINSWQTNTGKGLAWYAIMSNFGSSSNPQPMTYIDDYKTLVQQGIFKGLMYTWQPSSDWNWDRPSGTVTSQIASGVYDTYIRQEAIRCKNADYPIIIRFGHEMNGDWAGWGVNPTTFKQAWIKVVSIFHEENVNNVKFFWCANYADTGGRVFQDYYPGDEYVDYVGIDIYANSDWNWWWDPEVQIGNQFGNVYDTYPNKPFIIGEWGCTGIISDAQNVEFVNGMFDAIEKRSRIVGLFHWHAEDWKVDLYPQAFQAFKNRISNNLYTVNLLGWY